MTIIEAFTSEQLKENVPQFEIGDTVRVHNRITEGSKTRVQLYEGTVIARHGGGISATFDQLNKYFTISGMPVASSQYWNGVHGRKVGEASQDAEGLQTMRTLARNMVFLMKSIALGKEQFGLPEKEPRQSTHFIR